MLPLASAGLPAASALRSSRSSLCPARVLRVRPAPPRWSCSVSCVGRQPPAGAGASRAAHRSLSTAALAVSAERPAAGTEEDSPRDAVAAAEYRKLLDAEEEAGLYEEPDENEERVEVDASALPDDTLALSAFNLTKETHAALLARGVERLFPIQGATFKPLAEGRDLIGRARTGTGKTLAFSLPLIESMLKADAAPGSRGRGRGRTPRMLVMAPTRELALQVEREITATAPALACVCIYGGASISGQEGSLRRGCDVVVGTPGRLIDLVTRGVLSFDTLRHVVLDEADQMLAVGFEQDVEQLMEAMPADERRQVLLFSATMPHWVKKLARRYMHEPVTVDLVGDSSAKINPSVRMLSLACDPRAKQAMLADLVTVHAAGAKAICFTATKRECDEVAAALGRRVLSEALHGDIAQGQREKTLRRFREGRINVLVATDVAARGLDVQDVDLVVHYNFPQDTESFVHRSGRTGRAGRPGTAIALHSEREEWMLKRLSKETGCAFTRISPPSTSDVMTASARTAVEALKTVDDALLPYFTAAAEALIAQRGGASALAAALAVVAGHSEPPACRSLLTGEEGVMTVRMLRTSGKGPAVVAARDVLRILQRIPLPAGASPADGVGKIRLVVGQEAAVMDVKAAVAEALVALGDLQGIAFDVPTQLPALQMDDSASDRGGRGGFGGSRGGYAGRSGGGFSRDREGGRGGGYAGSRDRYDGGAARGGGGGFSRDRDSRPSYGGGGGRGGSYGGRDGGSRSGFSRSGDGGGRSYSSGGASSGGDRAW